MYKRQAIPWFLGEISIPVPEDFFVKRRWLRIGVCGKNAFAKKLIGALQQLAALEACFIYDVQQKPSIDYGVPQLSGAQQFPAVDLVINADLAYWKNMEQQIAARYSGDVVYMETLLRQLQAENGTDTEKEQPA